MIRFHYPVNHCNFWSGLGLQNNRTQIEIIQVKPRIMRNSNTKPQKLPTSTPVPEFSIYETRLASEASSPMGGKVYTTKNEAYESSYNYFIKKMEAQNKMENPIKPGHQRYNSMGSSRIIAKATVQSPRILNCESTPYLMNPVKPNPFLQDRSKMVSVTPVNQLKPPASSTGLSKQSMKLSMKGITKQPYSNCQFERQSQMRESQTSTANETVHTPSMTSKYAQEKIAKDELQRYFTASFERGLSVLRTQIQQQGASIVSLQNQIKGLNQALANKESKIMELSASLSVCNSPSKNFAKSQSFTNIQNAFQGQKLGKRVESAENQINSIIKSRMLEQSQAQKRINDKIEMISSKLIQMTKGSRSSAFSQVAQIGQDMTQYNENLRKFREVIQKSMFYLSQMEEIKNISLLVKQKCFDIKKKFSENAQDSFYFLQKTGEFAPDEPSMRNPHKKSSSKLQDSCSYFFHAGDLQNIQKITELFINRQGKPIKCYIDPENQVRYADTNTLMFNKKGDIVKLNEKERRYYIDRGYIFDRV